MFVYLTSRMAWQSGARPFESFGGALLDRLSAETRIGQIPPPNLQRSEKQSETPLTDGIALGHRLKIRSACNITAAQTPQMQYRLRADMGI